MTSTTSVSSGKQHKRRRLLSPSQKYELYVAVLTGQCTQREAAEKWRIDRTTVTTICRTGRRMLRRCGCGFRNTSWRK